MFREILKNTSATNDLDADYGKRRSVRRAADRCVGMINGQLYPVKNWSMSGTLVSVDSRRFALDDTVQISLKFMLREKLIEIAHQAKVVRKQGDGIALEFKPLTDDIRVMFQNIIDDRVTSQFADSQKD